MDDCYPMNERYVSELDDATQSSQMREGFGGDVNHVGSSRNVLQMNEGFARDEDDVGSYGNPLSGEEEDVNDDREIDDSDLSHQQMHETEDGTKYWIPRVSVENIPKIGDFFAKPELAEDCYRRYAEKSGFDVRLSNRKINKLGTVTSRYFVCSREGIPKPKSFDSLDVVSGVRKRRNTNVKRTGCKACFKVRFVKEKNGYELYKFVEWHNHILFSEEEMIFSRSSRKLSYVEQRNVFYSCSHKVGVTKGHRMRNALNKGGRKSGGTVRDYQNYRRDMNTFVGNKDAQMLINTMASRQKICPDYFYEYKCIEKELFAIFWADETARLNFKEFGDVISFDATFRTNKHAMSFVPFVAVDNHKKSVVVGAALISGESADHYTWILNAFLKAHGRQPLFVITDQCLAMKQAIPKALPDSKHRLCMWHITKKVENKISSHLKLKTTFVTEMNKLVWDVYLDPSVFEEKWKDLMVKYGLEGDSWFSEMYDIRESWIPAYFKDLPMSGLMKTTSRSESINAFFNVFHAFHHDLVVKCSCLSLPEFPTQCAKCLWILSS